MTRGSEPYGLLPTGQLRVESGPVSLVAAARWGGRERPAELAQAGPFALALLEELAAHRAVLSVDAGRIRNVSGLPQTARAMVAAAQRFPGVYVTPLVAVAGAVADAVAGFLVDRGADWVVVSNGGDVALRLGPGADATVGLQARLEDAGPAACLLVRADDGIGGVTTSGVRGRSFSLGVADAVTAFAETAAVADAASTLIANAVDVDSPAVERVAAEQVYPDSDLKGLRVTRRVGPLTQTETAGALDLGQAAAERAVAAGIIRGAALVLNAQWRFVGWPGEGGVEWLVNGGTASLTG